jgi:sulfate permease, SulP family
VCIKYGYLAGVVVGVLFACVFFAVSYARLGAIRRKADRSQFASYVDRSAEAASYLRNAGERVQIYWLHGYLFFGSSESLFDHIRNDVDALPKGRRAYIVVDFAMVSGADSSALASIAKLGHFCAKSGVILVFCGLSGKRSRLNIGSSAQTFKDLNSGLAWCEDQILNEAGWREPISLEAWLQQELGPKLDAGDLLSYFQQKRFSGPQVLYQQGHPADTLDLLASGTLVVELSATSCEAVRVRRIATHSVIGEMGFFRGTIRSATVLAEGEVSLFSLTRDNFERMKQERPELALALDGFILRVLADRLEFANQSVAALNPTA